MRKQVREESARARLLKMLGFLADGTVIVEGKHDKKALGELGIDSITYTSVEKGNVVPDHRKTVYIAMDMDKGGEEKATKLISRLLSEYKGYAINMDLPKSILRMLNAKSVEQICGPAKEIIEVV